MLLNAGQFGVFVYRSLQRSATPLQMLLHPGKVPQRQSHMGIHLRRGETHAQMCRNNTSLVPATCALDLKRSVPEVINFLPKPMAFPSDLMAFYLGPMAPADNPMDPAALSMDPASWSMPLA